MINPKWIVGKRVVAVDPQPFDSGITTGYDKRHRTRPAFDPVIWFEDGSSIAFTTMETEIGEYGTNIVYRKPATKRRAS